MGYRFVIWLLLLVSTEGLTQSFAQYYFVPQLFNPAWVGADSHLSLAANYRSHRMQELHVQRVSAALMSPVHWNGRKRLGIGMHFLSDQAEDLSSFSTQEAGAALAYHHLLATKHAISIGGQAVYQQGNLGLGEVTTGSQWVAHRGFDPQQSINETWGGLQQRAYQLSVGALWYRERRPGQLAHYVGVAAQSLNRSSLQWLDGSVQPSVRYTVQAGWQAFRRRQLSLTPEVLGWQAAGLRYLNVGGKLSYHFRNDNPFDPVGDGTVSLISRHTVGESTTLGIQIEQPHFVAGFAYDWGSRSSLESGYQATEYGIVLRRSIFRPKKKPTPTPTAPQRRTFSERALPEAGVTLPSRTSENDLLSQEQTNHIEADSARSSTTVTPERTRAFTFGFNETGLNEGTKRYLRDVVALLEQNPYLHVRVVGHTDDVGTAPVNQAVSEKRAEAVRNFLIEQGVETHRIQSLGRGSREPLTPNRDAVSRTKNRRIEIELYTP